MRSVIPSSCRSYPQEHEILHWKPQPPKSMDWTVSNLSKSAPRNRPPPHKFSIFFFFFFFFKKKFLNSIIATPSVYGGRYAGCYTQDQYVHEWKELAWGPIIYCSVVVHFEPRCPLVEMRLLYAAFFLRQSLGEEEIKTVLVELAFWSLGKYYSYGNGPLLPAPWIDHLADAT